MANKKITDLTELTSPADNDLVCIVDVSDTSGSSTGTTKKIQKSNLVTGGSSTDHFTISGGFFQNNTNFAYWSVSSASTTESAAVSYLTIAPMMAACRLVDVAVWVQLGAARDETINAYKHNNPGPSANLGGITASVSAGNVTVFTFNTSTFDYAAGDEFGLGWTPNTAPNGVSFIARLKFL